MINNWIYCKHCGERTISTTGFCLKCQADGWKPCPKCGHPVKYVWGHLVLVHQMLDCEATEYLTKGDDVKAKETLNNPESIKTNN